MVTMRVTERDQELLKKLAVCRWLMTSQVKALCFPNVSVEMARRRLRLLAQRRFVRTWRIGPLTEAIHSVGAEGKRLLSALGRSEELRLERRPPRHFEHSFAINDLRIWIERCARLEGFTIGFFYACWELPDVNWNAPIIPDAICLLEVADSQLTIAFEYDRGEESLPFIERTKLRAYSRGFECFPISKVVIVAEAEARALQLHAHAARRLEIERFLFTTRERLLSSKSVVEFLS